jgi:hypothetical protein
MTDYPTNSLESTKSADDSELPSETKTSTISLQEQKDDISLLNNSTRSGEVETTSEDDNFSLDILYKQKSIIVNKYILYKHNNNNN